MSLFDMAAGLLLGVSAVVGWIRGGAREVATVGALAVAAIAGLYALRYTGPIARHAIHTPVLANIVAILIVFAAVYVLLRVAASALIRRIHETSGLNGVDRMAGTGVGVVRALVVLGVVNLTLGAMIPADRMPAWISGAFLYPVSTLSARTLKAFAPQGVSLARQAAPVVSNAITGTGEDANAQNRSYDDPAGAGQSLRVEKSQ
jgi:membrane protein required for colicin V production